MRIAKNKNSEMKKIITAELVFHGRERQKFLPLLLLWQFLDLYGLK